LRWLERANDLPDLARTHVNIGMTLTVSPSLRIALLTNWGLAAARARRFDEGIARFDEAIDFASRLYGPQHSETFEPPHHMAVYRNWPSSRTLPP
jgi:hypothetical protein